MDLEGSSVKLVLMYVSYNIEKMLCLHAHDSKCEYCCVMSACYYAWNELLQGWSFLPYSMFQAKNCPVIN
jgi:hypothetical protein